MMLNNYSFEYEISFGIEYDKNYYINYLTKVKILIVYLQVLILLREFQPFVQVQNDFQSSFCRIFLLIGDSLLVFCPDLFKQI